MSNIFIIKLFMIYYFVVENYTEQNPAWLLLRGALPAKLAFAKIAEQFELTHMQLFTLCLVESCKGGPVMQGITTALGCDASNVTGLVDKLVHQGFLERSESPHDRRAKIIKLTRKGQLVQQDAMRAFAKSNFLDVLTPGETRALVRILAKLQSHHAATVMRS